MKTKIVAKLVLASIVMTGLTSANPIHVDAATLIPTGNHLIFEPTREAANHFGESFSVGHLLEIHPDAVVPIVLETDTIVLSVGTHGSTHFEREFCESMAPELSHETGELDDTVVLTPENLNGAISQTIGAELRSAFLITTSGTFPAKPDLLDSGTMKCFYELSLIYTYLGSPFKATMRGELEASVPNEVWLPFGACTGHEGFANCGASDLVDLPAGTLPIVGLAETMELDVESQFTFSDLDGTDEDRGKARLGASSGITNEQEVSPDALTRHLSIDVTLLPNSSETLCASLTVEDIDQWWDFGGAKVEAQDSFCLTVKYTKPEFSEIPRIFDCKVDPEFHECLSSLGALPAFPGDSNTWKLPNDPNLYVLM